MEITGRYNIKLSHWEFDIFKSLMEKFYNNLGFRETDEGAYNVNEFNLSESEGELLHKLISGFNFISYESQ